MSFFATDGAESFLKIAIDRRTNRQAQVTLLFTLPDGTTYQLPGEYSCSHNVSHKNILFSDFWFMNC